MSYDFFALFHNLQNIGYNSANMAFKNVKSMHFLLVDLVLFLTAGVAKAVLEKSQVSPRHLKFSQIYSS